MKMGLFLLGFMLMHLLPIYVNSQTPNMNGRLAKYWFYRWRLRNDFMVMGEGPGKSLIAESRNEFRTQYMKWADATIMHGYYLAMLAIEHKILESKNRWEDLKNNERELYFAIKAFERLDYVSETFYSSEGNNHDAYRVGDIPLQPDINGYFFRDDVPPDFLNHDPDIEPNPYNEFTVNYYKLTSNKTGIDYGYLTYNLSDYSSLWGLTLNTSTSPPDLLNPQHPIVNYKKGTTDIEPESGITPFGYGEESQDQVIRLLLGFMTIIKSVPFHIYSIDRDKDGVNDATMNFYNEAQRHSTNIIGRMAGRFSGTTVVGTNDNAFVPYWDDLLESVGSSYWTILNPRHKQVSIGGGIYQYMIPIRAVSFPLFTTQNDIGITQQNYVMFPLNPSAYMLWNAGINGYNDWVNAKMALILNVISHSGTGILPVGRFIAKKSAQLDIDGFYVPLFDYFWDWNPSSDKDKERKQHAYNYADLMLTAAPCVGPHNFGKTGHSINGASLEPPFSVNQQPSGIPYYWNVPFLFDNPHETWDDGIGWDNENHEQTIHEGWFSGVDYMLLYNLIYANNDSVQPLYHDLINRLVDYDINTDLQEVLSNNSADGLMIGAFENMRITNNIFGNTPITIKALDFIEIDNGVISPQQNGEIIIETGKITCGDNFTSSNTPYSRSQCETCGIEGQIGSTLAPQTEGRVWSAYIEMPTIDELERSSNKELVGGEVELSDFNGAIYPNPVTDFFQLVEVDNIMQIHLMDQNGVTIKTFNPKERMFDAQRLTPGIYTLQLNLTDNEIKYIKLVKL